MVDNASTDATAHMAATFGVRVISESVRSIGRVRNSAAAAAHGRRLFFTDADVALPMEAITAAAAAMDTGAVGGAIPPLYTPKRLGARLLCAYWDHYRTAHGGAQGVAQFATAFKEVGGYQDDLFMSEDVDFFARLTAHGRATAAPVAILDDLRVRQARPTALIAGILHSVSKTGLGVLAGHPHHGLAVSEFVRRRAPQTDGTHLAVLHPPFAPPQPSHPMTRTRSVLMVNPIPAKGSDLMHQLIRAMPEQHFTLVEGWWNTADQFTAYPNTTFVARVYDMNPSTAATAFCWCPPRWRTHSPG